jgi:hypothetical protein
VADVAAARDLGQRLAGIAAPQSIGASYSAPPSVLLLDGCTSRPSSRRQRDWPPEALYGKRAAYVQMPHRMAEIAREIATTGEHAKHRN